MKSIALIMILVVGLSFVGAQESDVNFDRLKETVLRLIDNSINRLNNVENAISGHPKIDEETKQNIINAFNTAEEKLLSYKEDVEAAQSIDEIRAVNQEVIQYLRDNKDLIRENVKKALINLGEKFVEKAEELKEKIEVAIRVLKKTCPGEADTINEVENQLAELEQNIINLKDAVTAKDKTKIKQEVKAIKSLSKSILENLKVIEDKCVVN